MKRQNLLIRTVAAVVVLVFGIGLYATGADLEVTWLKFFGPAVSVASLLLWLWDNWLWRTSLAQRIDPVNPNIRGTWKGSLESFWEDPETGQRPAVKTIYLVVRQTASQVTISLLTDESRSTSTAGTIVKSESEVQLLYLYLNTPDLKHQGRSRIHFGSVKLEVHGKPGRRLRGQYWTDRDSKGELEFTDRHDAVTSSYREAEALFGESAA
jgi:hypothetical protein